MYPVAMTIINPTKEYWPSRGLNQQPPVLKSCMPQTEPHRLSYQSINQSVESTGVAFVKEANVWN